MQPPVAKIAVPSEPYRFLKNFSFYGSVDILQARKRKERKIR